MPQQKDRRRIFHWQLRTYKTKSKSVRMRQTAVKANVSLSSIVFLFLFQSLQSDVRIVAEFSSYFIVVFYMSLKIDCDYIQETHLITDWQKYKGIRYFLHIWSINKIKGVVLNTYLEFEMKIQYRLVKLNMQVVVEAISKSCQQKGQNKGFLVWFCFANTQFTKPYFHYITLVNSQIKPLFHQPYWPYFFNIFW